MIEIRGARSNNLRSVDVDVPHERLVVITGLSGSGKSSLALQTLYAEGQRRYVESLSAYARQFLGRLQKPEVDSIHGLPPAIALEQRVQSRNPRSTVGTMTEVYEYLRLLFARVGHTFSPASGQEVRKQTADDAVRIMQQYSPGTRFLVLCRPKSTIETLRSQGFARIEVGGQVRDINEYEPREGDDVLLVIDRMQAGSDTDTLSRLTDSAETALWEGAGEMMLRFMPAGILHTITTRLELDGMRFEEPTDQLFAFNSPMGACPECEGYGKVVGIDERLVVPDTSLSVQAGAVVPWRGEKLGDWRKWFVRLNQPRGFPVHKPYYELSAAERDWLWHGTLPEGSTLSKEEEEWGPLSIDAFFESLRQAQYKIQNRVMLARYRGKTLCPTCRGARLRKEATYVMVGGRRITELVEMPVKELRTWMQRLALPPHEETIAKRLLKEIRSRLDYICDVGLGYLTLNRPAQTLSGGESQRLGLATQIGSSLVGSLYILDEPSIGLHSRDTERLIAILKQLRDAGNTVVVVEHDEEIIRAADWIIDLGPEAGELGGEVVYAGPPMPTKVKKKDIRRSHTLRYLLGQETMALPKSRRPWNQYIEVQGARANNLRGIDVRFPLNVLTCITGVSGSGKSSLVHDILYLALRRHFDQANELPGEHQGIAGDLEAISAVEFVDQHPIGRSSRSNPVTYIHAWDDIRRLYAQQPAAQAQGFGAGHFSFNTDGGRCEECKGEGKTTVEMQFMADLELECETCHGRRFKPDVLEVKYQGLDVCDVLNLTVSEAIAFFANHGQERIVQSLRPLADVGLGYIRLGQSSSTLSGGENQRVKLAYHLGQQQSQPTLFIFDEPTTGLHYHDIALLMQAFDRLLRKGHTFVVIEHNLDVVRQADWVVDLGPEGGERGGSIVCQGTPEDVACCPESHTGRILQSKL